MLGSALLAALLAAVNAAGPEYTYLGQGACRGSAGALPRAHTRVLPRALSDGSLCGNRRDRQGQPQDHHLPHH